ncbi:MAG: NifB/NifX family molybdenum-iron cluster-binding protein [Nanoarchaeota archaeon]|nr:NifB/NifX family molybdenum-iron cluster-binding protein [Nanoarchaeota archaeon]
MKIAISSNGTNLESKIDPRFGRCNNFVIVEVEDNKIKSDKGVANPGLSRSGGAGIAAAQFMGNENIEVVITGKVGPNAYTVLDKIGVKMYHGVGTVKDSIEQYIQGKLTQL